MEPKQSLVQQKLPSIVELSNKSTKTSITQELTYILTKEVNYSNYLKLYIQFCSVNKLFCEKQVPQIHIESLKQRPFLKIFRMIIDRVVTSNNSIRTSTLLYIIIATYDKNKYTSNIGEEMLKLTVQLVPLLLGLLEDGHRLNSERVTSTRKLSPFA